MTGSRISDSAVRRLSLYLRFLRDLRGQGVELVSSQQLADFTGATAAQVRKDLSLFGSFGKRGRGYDADALETTLEEILGLGRRAIAPTAHRVVNRSPARRVPRTPRLTRVGKMPRP